MKKEDGNLSAAVTTGVAFLRVHSWDYCDRARQWVVRFFSRLSRPQRIALKVAVTASLAFLFAYSWTHSGAPQYYPSGKQELSWTLPLGMVLLASAISVLGELSGKE